MGNGIDSRINAGAFWTRKMSFFPYIGCEQKRLLANLHKKQIWDTLILHPPPQSLSSYNPISVSPYPKMEKSDKLSGFDIAPNRRILHFFGPRHPSNIGLLNELVDNDDAIFVYQNYLRDWPTLHASLMDMVELLAQIETIFVIKTGWVNCFTGEGVFGWHRDKGYSGCTHRIIFTLGAFEKTMRFKCAGKSEEISVFMPHNSFVALTRAGGGVVKNKKGESIRHMVDCANNSMTVTIHASRKVV